MTILIVMMIILIVMMIILIVMMIILIVMMMRWWGVAGSKCRVTTEIFWNFTKLTSHLADNTNHLIFFGDNDHPDHDDHDVCYDHDHDVCYDHK